MSMDEVNPASDSCACLPLTSYKADITLAIRQKNHVITLGTLIKKTYSVKLSSVYRCS